MDVASNMNEIGRIVGRTEVTMPHRAWPRIAVLIALTCGEKPEGEGRWSLRLLANKLVALQDVDEVSYETVRRILKKTNSSRG